MIRVLILKSGAPHQSKSPSSEFRGGKSSDFKIRASPHAFAAILSDGSGVTWGAAWVGGDSSAVQEQLKNVQQIPSTGYAFAAILSGGSVVTWSHARFGGDNSAVQDQLNHVQQSKPLTPLLLPFLAMDPS